MLKRFVKLTNVGLLRNGTPAPAQFDTITLIYAENGRGKSTVANLLRAIGALDTSAVVAGRTIDSEDAPSLELLCEQNGAHNPVKLNNGIWTGVPPEILVFDPTFVEENVYSGQEVRPEQRQALLQFALGEASVKLEKQISELTNKISEETRKISDTEKRILAFGKQMPIAHFIGLADVPDAEAQIVSLNSRMEAAKNAAALKLRAAPDRLPQIELDVDSYFNILKLTFHGIREDAKATVQSHFERHKKQSGIEEWVTTGREFGVADGCPFCGQDISNAALIEAYDAYFNNAYEEFMTKVSTLTRGVEFRLADSKIDDYVASLKINDARINAWKDQLELISPIFDADLARKTLGAIRTLAGDLALRKQRRPLERMGTSEEILSMARLLGQIRTQVDNHNTEIDSIAKRIRDFNRDLAADNQNALAGLIARMDAVIVKRSPQAQAALTEYTTASKLKNELGTKKKEAKAALEKDLPEILKRYQEHINAFLQLFGAEFSIERLTSGSPGGQIRSEYGLRLRGRSVELGKRTDTSPSFRSVLSEGDKRTLALSLFFARLHAAQSLKGKVIVLDDPVCSMDANRRTRTMSAIAEIVSKGAQVVVLSHDAYFLKDLSELLDGPPHKVTAKVHEIKRSALDYSEFAACDLDVICLSEYDRRYNNVSAYIDGTYTGSNRDLADDLRPVVEGFFKRRFPFPLLPKLANLGAIIKEIASASDDSPLALAKPYLTKLDALNRFSTGFHHDDAKPVAPLNNVELLQHAKMALELIHGDP